MAALRRDQLGAAPVRRRRAALLLLRGFDGGQCQSSGEARWLVELEDYPEVVPGSVLVVSEGPRPVGFFLVDDADLGTPGEQREVLDLSP